jgi:hypothetical protein
MPTAPRISLADVFPLFSDITIPIPAMISAITENIITKNNVPVLIVKFVGQRIGSRDWKLRIYVRAKM